MRIAFRVDASATIGLGHLLRCMSLADAARELGAEVKFVCRDMDVDVTKRLESANFAMSILPATDATRDEVIDDGPPHAAWAQVAWSVDAEQSIQVLAPWRPDWIVVDHYALDARWHAEMADSLAARVAVIDDLADRPLRADLLIDHNFDVDHAAKYAGRMRKPAALLGGPRFALIGPRYAQAPRYVPSRAVRSIGIFMGGVDAGNVSSLAWRACREVAGFQGPIEIVTTGANPNLAALRELVAADPSTGITLDAPDLAAFFAQHDLQIGAGGGATWERCCIGAPTLGLVAATNQLTVIPKLAALGLLATLEDGAELSVENIGAAVRPLLLQADARLKLGESASHLVDGLGARRVALNLLKDGFSLRPATLADADLMFEWRNAPATRAVSHQSEPLGWESHLQWLRDALANPTRHLMVGSVGTRAVGVIRFDEGADGTAEVSLYLDPTMHGLGLGARLLRAGEAVASSEHRLCRFVASVRDGNQASIRLFESTGYVRESESGLWTKTININQPAAHAPAQSWH